MATYASITPETGTDGVLYCQNVPVTVSEGDLYNQITPHPIPVTYGQAIQAIVFLTVTGAPFSNSTYIVMQSDLGDGRWIDIAWIVWTGISGDALFVLSSPVAGANAFQQTRHENTAPGSAGSNAIPLGGRIRFVGRAQTTGSLSQSPGVGASVTVQATIRYRIMAAR